MYFDVFAGGLFSVNQLQAFNLLWCHATTASYASHHHGPNAIHFGESRSWNVNRSNWVKWYFACWFGGCVMFALIMCIQSIYVHTTTHWLNVLVGDERIVHHIPNHMIGIITIIINETIFCCSNRGLAWAHSRRKTLLKYSVNSLHKCSRI